MNSTMTQRPNILFIVADDLGYADLSCCGQTDYRTPQLDDLAARGTRFTQSYANAPLCTNTRVALMTGRYQYRYKLGLTEPLRFSRTPDPEMGLPRDCPTLPGRLRAAGYATALIGKWHLGALPWHGPLKSGYDEFFGVMGGYTGYFTHHGDGGVHDLYEGETAIDIPGYVTELLSTRAVEYVRRHAGQDRPFFLSLHYTAPHWPWSAPSVEAASRLREQNFSAPAEGGSPRIYAEMVQEMDKGIGRVLEALRATGADGRTLVIFTSDNGGERYSKNWPFVGRKLDLLEGGVRVPQIVTWPGKVAAGRVTDQVAITMDLTATCLAAAGVKLESAAALDGESLLPQLAEGAPTRSRTLFWRMKQREQRAVRRGGWKYLKVADREFLFDLEYDWRERANFAAEQPELVAELKALWEAWNEDMLQLPEQGTPSVTGLPNMLW